MRRRPPVMKPRPVAPILGAPIAITAHAREMRIAGQRFQLAECTLVVTLPLIRALDPHPPAPTIEVRL